MIHNLQITINLRKKNEKQTKKSGQPALSRLVIGDSNSTSVYNKTGIGTPKNPRPP